MGIRTEGPYTFADGRTVTVEHTIGGGDRLRYLLDGEPLDDQDQIDALIKEYRREQGL